MIKKSLPFALLTFLFCAVSFAGAPKTLVGTIPIGPDNPRNSEGDFIRLKDGTIRYFYTRFRGQSSDDFAPADLVFRDSADDGKTWAETDSLALANEGSVNTMSVTVRRLPDGRIALFYLVKDHVGGNLISCRPYMRISEDEADTWSERISLDPDVSYYVVNNDRVEILADGRILVPVARHSYNADGTITASADIFCLISDDSGATWRKGEQVRAAEGVVFQEPGVCQLADGRILMNIRTDAGSQYFAYSEDGGQSWGQPAPSVLDSPLSPAVIKRIPGSDDLLAVWNPLRAGRAAGWGSRAFMYYGRLSADGGRLLGRRFIVGTLDSEDQGWQYPAVLFNGDGTFLTAFFSVRSGINLWRIAVPRVETLFNGRDLAGWTKYLNGRGTGEDPENVFTVQNGVIRISGAEWGGISTDGEYSDYHASLEFKWGKETHGPRKGLARDTGFLFHASGEEGGFARIWLYSFEANIVEGGIGDFWLVGNEEEGYTATGQVTMRGDQRIFDPKGGENVTLTKHAQGPFRWWGFDPDWKDVTGFRSKDEIAEPGEWTRLEVVAEGDAAEFYVNGVLVNRVTNLSRTSGRLQIQSEGAEVFYRNITVTQ